MILQMRNESNTQGLLDLIDELPTGLTMLEIGCYAGESTELFLKSGKVKKLYAVDIWTDPLGVFSSMNPSHNFKEVEESFDKKVSGFDVIKYKKSIQEISTHDPNVSNLDFIYVDANHDYEYVLEDIKTSLTLLKKGGIISGHDYNPQTPGVIKAVNEILGYNIKVYADSSWLVNL
jgi:predicted O-methyltransferase YrrM